MVILGKPVFSVITISIGIIYIMFRYYDGDVKDFHLLGEKSDDSKAETTLYSQSNSFVYNQRFLLSFEGNNTKLADELWILNPAKNKDRNLTLGTKTSKLIKQKHKINVLFSNPDVQSTEKPPEYTNTAAAKVSTASDTTPLFTEAPTKPIQTESVTTPLVTEAPTTPITTESITTPIVTEAGAAEITTEGDLSDTILLIRNRRQNGNAGSTTTVQPSASPTASNNCGNNANSYPNGNNCECKPGFKGDNCDEEDSSYSAAQDVTFTSQVVGEYTDEQRAAFQEQLEDQYGDQEGFSRIYVYPMVYNATTGKTTLRYTVIYDNEANAAQATQAASTARDITGQVLPITVNGQQVVFGVNSTFLEVDNQGVLEFVPIAAIADEDVCFLYNKLDACLNGAKCFNDSGTPACACVSGFHGQYCSEPLHYNDAAKILRILVPVLIALGVLVLLCSCCFVFCRRVHRGDGESAPSLASSSSRSTTAVPVAAFGLPRYFHADTTWRNVDTGPKEPMVFEHPAEEEYNWAPNYGYVAQDPEPALVVTQAYMPVIRKEYVPVLRKDYVPVIRKDYAVTESHLPEERYDYVTDARDEYVQHDPRALTRTYRSEVRDDYGARNIIPADQFF